MGLGILPGTVTDYWILAAGVIFFGGIMLLIGLRIYSWYKRMQSADILDEGTPTDATDRRSYLRSTLDWIFLGPSLQSAGLSHLPREDEKMDFGLRPSIIETLPTFTVDGEIRQVPSTEMKECPVCLEEYKEGEKVRLLPACVHCFHAECIDMWLFSHTTCPICRCDVASSIMQTLLGPAPGTYSPESSGYSGAHSPVSSSDYESRPQIGFSFTDTSEETSAAPSGAPGRMPSSLPYIDLEVGENSRGLQISETYLDVEVGENDRGFQISETSDRQFQEQTRDAVHLATGC